MVYCDKPFFFFQYYNDILDDISYTVFVHLLSSSKPCTNKIGCHHLCQTVVCVCRECRHGKEYAQMLLHSFVPPAFRGSFYNRAQAVFT